MKKEAAYHLKLSKSFGPSSLLAGDFSPDDDVATHLNLQFIRRTHSVTNCFVQSFMSYVRRLSDVAVCG